MKQVSRWKPLPAAEECALAARIKKGDRQALSMLVNTNLRFVINVAKNYMYQGMPLKDLINEGNLGLIKAAYRFDERKNFKFISYAVWWIRQSILQAIANQSRLVRVSLNKVGQLCDFNRTHARLIQRDGHEPTHDDIAYEMGIDSAQLETMMYLLRPAVALDASRTEGGNSTIMDLLVADEDTAAFAEENNIRDKIQRLLGILSERERKIIELHFGLSEAGGTGSTLQEIASLVGVTRERVRQIRNRAVDKLKARARELYATMGTIA